MKWLPLMLVAVSLIQQRSCQATSRNSCLNTPNNQFITPQGAACCFPFVFDNRIFYSCTDYKHNQPWCSVTSEYSKKWGNCITVSGGRRTTLRPPTGPCSFAYTIHRDTNSWNGRLMPANVTNIQACRDYCDNDGLSCAGFDYDSVQSPNRCYAHSSFSILHRNSESAPGITQYMKDGACFYKSAETRNACFNIKRGNTHSQGGTEILGVSNLLSCMDACGCQNDCLGFDFTIEGSLCHIHTYAPRFRNRQPREGVDQYEKTTCT